MGQTISLSVVATGSPTPSFKWKKNGTEISGAKSATLILSNLQPANAGTYSVVITNIAGTVSSSPALVTVNTPPKITTKPVGRTVIAGQTASLSVVASGTPSPTLQWLKNGAPVANATAATLTFASVQPTDAGSYVAVVSNPLGTVSSSAAVLIVNVTPAFSVQPVGGTFSMGQTVSLSVTATGTPTPTLQWKKNGTEIGGAKSATLTLSNIQPANAGNYTVVATNAAGSVSSSAAVVFVNTPPRFTTQPVSHGVFADKSTSFSAVVTGTPSPTFQWLKNGSPISGATASTLSIASVVLTDSGSYTLVAVNSLGTATSSAVTLSVSVPKVPTVVTGIVSSVSPNSIGVRGTVSADGGATVTERGVLVGLTSGLTLSNSGRIQLGSGTGTFSGSAVGSSISLSTGTPYFYRAYAINSAGAGLGPELTATTSLGTLSLSSALDHWSQIKTKSTSAQIKGIASNGALYVAVGRKLNPNNDGLNHQLIQTSSDGVTWTERFTASVSSPGISDKDSLLSVLWNGTQFLAVGGGGSILTSPDGIAWTNRTTTSISADLENVAWNDKNLYVAVGHNLSTVVNTTDQTLSATIITSPDGIAWTTRTKVTSANFLKGVVWNGKQFTAVGGTASLTAEGLDFTRSTGVIVTSRDGITSWSDKATALLGFLNRVAWNGKAFAAVGEGVKTNTGKGFIATSTDGSKWNSRVLNANEQGGQTNETALKEVVYAAGFFVATGNKEKILTSRDGGTTWSLRNQSTDSDADVLSAVTSNGRSLLAAGFAGSVLATNFISTISALAKLPPANAEVPVTAKLLASSAQRTAGLVLTEEIDPDATPYVATVSGVKNTPNSGSSSTDQTSVTFSTLTVNAAEGLNTPVNPVTIASLEGHILRDATWNGSLYVAAGDAGTVVTSTDGLDWTSRTSGTVANLLAVLWDGTQWLAVGSLPSDNSDSTAETVLLASPDGIKWTAAAKKEDAE